VPHELITKLTGPAGVAGASGRDGGVQVAGAGVRDGAQGGGAGGDEGELDVSPRGGWDLVLSKQAATPG
jgi:hypothetical protein